MWCQTSAPSVYWWDITSDSTGKLLAATQNGGYIYYSTNYGNTWTQSQSPNLGWTAISSDRSGSNLVAVTWSTGIYTSSTGSSIP